VTVAVTVPDSYIEDVWRRTNPTPAGQQPQPPDAKALADIEKQELDRIRDHVVQLIPKPGDVLDPTPLVKVTKFITPTIAGIPETGAGELAMSFFGEHWQTLGLIALVLLSLLMVRSMVRATPAEARAMELTLPPVAAKPASEEQPKAKAEATGETAKSRLKRRAASGKSLRDELTDMVKEDPETAANILRGWIGTGN
jgi:flagellar M-ring protein FliF